MLGLQPRREVWDYGLLPLHGLCPQLDGPNAVLRLHRALHALATVQPDGKRVVSPEDVSSVLELNPGQLQVLQEVLSALSLSNSTDPRGPAQLGQELIYLHELSLFLFCQLFSKEAQRPDSMEFWPAPEAPGAASSMSIGDLMSPTRGHTARSPGGGRSMLRSQLQAALRMQFHSARGFGDYLRRHLRTLLDLLSDTLPPPQMRTSASGAAPATAGSAAAPGGNASGAAAMETEGATMLSAEEVDRLGFVLLVGAGRVSAVVPSLSSGPQPVEQVLACLRSAWEESDRERMAAAHSANNPSSSSTLASSSSSSGLNLSSAAGGPHSPFSGGSGGNSGGMSGGSLFGNSMGMMHASVESPRLAPLGSFSGGLPSPSPKCNRGPGGSSVVAPLLGQGQVDEGTVAGLVKATVARGESDLTRGEVRVSDCHDSILYLLAPLQAALISCCSDCTVVVGAVGRLLRVDKCDRVQVIAATNRLLISNCHECTFYVGTPTPPLLVGDNRFVRLAPCNARYEAHAAHAAAAGVRTDMPNRFDSPLQLTSQPARERGRNTSNTPDSPRALHPHTTSPLGNTNSSSTHNSAALNAHHRAAWSLLPEDDFLPFVVPFAGGQGPMAGGAAASHATRWSMLASTLQRSSRTNNPAASNPSSTTGATGSTSNTGCGTGDSGGPPLYLWPLPGGYERALQSKLNCTHELRSRFKQAGIAKEKEKDLNDAIQGYFKEWLFTSGMLRQVYDLSALEREEIDTTQAAAAAAAAAGAGSHAAAAAAHGQPTSMHLG